MRCLRAAMGGSQRRSEAPLPRRLTSSWRRHAVGRANEPQARKKKATGAPLGAKKKKTTTRERHQARRGNTRQSRVGLELVFDKNSNKRMAKSRALDLLPTDQKSNKESKEFA